MRTLRSSSKKPICCIAAKNMAQPAYASMLVTVRTRGRNGMAVDNRLICLLVEDEPLILKLLTAQLEDGGFAVVTACDGLEGLQIIADPYAAIDAVVTDIRMPRLDGWALAQQARKAMPDVPVVYVSGDSADLWDSNGVPNSLMLQKPFVGEQLLTALATLIRLDHSSESASRRLVA